MKKKIGEKNGFGKSSCRFSGVRSTTPGPAYYHNPELFTLEAKGPSFSKKGFGNAFISTEEKIAYPKDNGVPGPNAYKLPDLGENIQAGIKFGDGVKKSTIGICDKNVPGVNTYFVKSEYEQVWSHYMKKKSSASLCSKSDRLAKPQNVDPNAPGPGTYNVDPNANTVQKNFAWSKSRTQRNDDLTRDNGLPGPGSYFKTRPVSRATTRGGKVDFDMTAIDEARKSMRTAGNYRGRYVGKQNDTRSPAMSTFGADKDRFKNSFCGRLDLAALIPGPGSYSLPELGAGISSGIKFVQSGKGRRPFDLPEPIPGPAYYSPKHIVATAQCQNLDGRWV
jgi:hypothetical protein